MALINNYGDLVQAVTSYLNRTDASAVVNIPMFLSFAQSDLNQLLDLPQDEGSYAQLVAFDGEAINIPEDLETPKSILINAKIPATRVSYEQFFKLPENGLTNDVWDRINYNQWFTKLGNTYIFKPELKEGDSVFITYNKHHTEMQVDTDTNNSLPECGELLIYLALRHSAIFFRDNEQEQFWAQKAEEIAQRLSERYRREQQDGSIPRIHSN